MPTLNIIIDERTKNALERLARQEVRDPRGQALVIIRQKLEERGLLSENTAEPEEARQPGVKYGPQ